MDSDRMQDSARTSAPEPRALTGELDSVHGERPVGSEAPNSAEESHITAREPNGAAVGQETNEIQPVPEDSSASTGESVSEKRAKDGPTKTVPLTPRTPATSPPAPA